MMLYRVEYFSFSPVFLFLYILLSSILVPTEMSSKLQNKTSNLIEMEISDLIRLSPATDLKKLKSDNLANLS